MAPGDSFLGAHGATLEPQGVGRWQLSYQVGGFDYGERLPSSVDVALPIAAATRDEALLLAGRSSSHPPTSRKARVVAGIDSPRRLGAAANESR